MERIHFIIITALLVYTSSVKAEGFFSPPVPITHDTTETEIVSYTPDGLGYLLGQTPAFDSGLYPEKAEYLMDGESYIISSQGNTVQMTSSSVYHPAITPKRVEFIYPSRSDSWRSPEGYLLYTLESYSIGFVGVTIDCNAMSIQSNLPDIVSPLYLKGDYIYSSSAKKATTSTHYEIDRFCTTNYLRFFYEGTAQTNAVVVHSISDSSTNTYNHNIIADFPEFALGWNQDTNQFETLRKDGNQVFYNNITSDTPTATITLASELSNTTILNGASNNANHALALLESQTLTLWSNQHSSPLTISPVTADPTSTTLWFDELDNLFFFNSNGDLVYLSSDGQTSQHLHVAQSGETVLAGDLNHFSESPNAIFLLENSSGDSILRYVNWKASNWNSIDLPYLPNAEITPASVKIETTPEVGAIIVLQTTSPQEEWYYLEEAELSGNNIWMIY